jgi:hypothetical protein
MKREGRSKGPRDRPVSRAAFCERSMILQRSGNLLFELTASGGTRPTCGRASMNWETKFWKRIKL